MKKLISLFLALVLAVACCGTCLAAPKNDKNAYRQILDEGFTYDEGGATMVVSWCTDGDAQIFGRMWLPGDFDENNTYPAIIMCHGHSGNADFWEKYFGPQMARLGYVCYAIDCRSAHDGARDYSTPNDDHIATVSTYARDIIAATNFMLEKPFVDPKNVYLAGQSMGGMGIQAAASQIPEKINGLMVLYGFLSESVRDMMDNYDEVVANPYSNGEVLMMGGTLDAACNWTNVEQNMALYPKRCSMILISGARHGYGKEDTRPEQISSAAMDDFIQRTKR